MADDENIMDFCFYSMPPSPIKYLHEKDAHQTHQPTTPTSTYHDANSSFFDDDDYDEDDDDNFEFVTSRRFNLDHDRSYDQSDLHYTDQQKQKLQESYPAMASADELFRDGKLVMPLKPPPFLQYEFGYSRLSSKTSLYSSSSSSSSPTSMMMKIPFPGRRSLWNDDFDPFMAALENVKQEMRSLASTATNHRRTRSLSPLRSSTNDQVKRSPPWIHHPNKHQKPAGCQTCPNCPIVLSGPNHEMGNQDVLKLARVGKVSDDDNSEFAQRKPRKLAEPRGVLFARQARLVKMRCCENKLAAREESENGSGRRESKTQKIKKLLLRSMSIGKLAVSEEGEEGKMSKDEDEELGASKSKSTSKYRVKRKFRLNESSMGTGLVQYKKKERRLSVMTKMTIIPYKPKQMLLLCIGFGSKFVK